MKSDTNEDAGQRQLDVADAHHDVVEQPAEVRGRRRRAGCPTLTAATTPVKSPASAMRPP
jgi:hypothetical protein